MYFRWAQGPVQGECKSCHTLQVDGVEQLVSGEGPPDFRLPATLQQYVEHGGCLFKVRGMYCLKFQRVTFIHTRRAALVVNIECSRFLISYADQHVLCLCQSIRQKQQIRHAPARCML